MLRTLFLFVPFLLLVHVTSAISRTELGKKITDGTLFLSCLMTYAQIEKLRAEKVMFSDLD